MMEGMRGVPHTTINQKLAAIAAEMAVVVGINMGDNDVGDDNVGDDTWVSMADNGGVDGGGQQRGWRRWLGQWRTSVWSMAKGDNVGQEWHSMRHAEWRK